MSDNILIDDIDFEEDEALDNISVLSEAENYNMLNWVAIPLGIHDKNSEGKSSDSERLAKIHNQFKD